MKSRGLIGSWLDRLFGYDVFISYAHADGTAYANKLAEELRSQRLSVFLDTVDHEYNQDLDAGTRRRVAMSSKLVVIVRTHAPDRPWVRREVEVAIEKKVDVVVIDVDQTFERLAADAPLRRSIRTIPLTLRDSAVGLDALPGEHVAKTLVRGLETTRRDRRRLRVFLAATAILAIALGVAVWQYREAVDAKELEAEARKVAEQAQKVAEQARAVEAAARVAADAATLAAREALRRAEQATVDAMAKNAELLARTSGQGVVAIEAGVAAIDWARKTSSETGAGVFDALARAIGDTRTTRPVIAPDQVLTAGYDVEGGLWTGDVSGRITYQSDRHANAQWHVSGGVTDIAVAPDGCVLAISNGGSLFVACRDTSEELTVEKGRSLLGIATRPDGVAYIASYEGRIFRIARSTLNGESPGVSGKSIHAEGFSEVHVIDARHVAYVADDITIVDGDDLHVIGRWSSCDVRDAEAHVRDVTLVQSVLVVVDDKDRMCRIAIGRSAPVVFAGPGEKVTTLQGCDRGLVAGSDKGRLWVLADDGWKRLAAGMGSVERIECAGSWLAAGDKDGRFTSFRDDRELFAVLLAGGARRIAIAASGAMAFVDVDGHAQVFVPEQGASIVVPTIERIGMRNGHLFGWDKEALHRIGSLESPEPRHERFPAPYLANLLSSTELPQIVSGAGSSYLQHEWMVGHRVKDFDFETASRYWPTTRGMTTPVLAPDGKRMAIFQDKLEVYHVDSSDPVTLGIRPWLPLGFAAEGNGLIAMDDGEIGIWPDYIATSDVHRHTVGQPVVECQLTGMRALVTVGLFGTHHFVFDLTNGDSIWDWTAEGTTVSHATLRADARVVMSADEHGIVRRWELDDPKAPTMLDSKAGRLDAIVIAGDDKRFALATSAHEVLVYERVSAQRIATYDVASDIKMMLMDKDDAHVVVLTTDGAILRFPATRETIEEEARKVLR